MMTPTDPPPPREVRTTTDHHNNDLSLQLLRLYATPQSLMNAQLHVIYRQPLPTFEEFARRLARCRN